MGKMKNSVSIVLISVVIFIIITAGIVGSSYIGNYNYGNRAEKTIMATWEDNENILSQYSLKVMEIAQVPEIYKNNVKEIVTAEMSGRYGENGSSAMMQWLKEQNPELDSKLYIKVQQVMEAGRNEFQVAQTRLVDQKRIYNTNLGYLWRGFWLRIAGYPKINLNDYKVIVSEHTNEVFDTGIDKGIKLQDTQ